jgi:hypothetical protein
LEGRGGWRIDNLSLTQVGEHKIIGTAQLTDDDGTPRESNLVVFTFSDGKILDMQGFASQHEAERFARRH